MAVLVTTLGSYVTGFAAAGGKVVGAIPEGLPPLLVGELAILSVTEQASMAKILDSRYTVHLGDRLEPKTY